MRGGYEYIRQLRNLFIPRTPGAALQAASENILPIEAFVYKSTALNPLLKKPYKLDEIDWLLSRKDRDLNTNLILKTVLDEISRDEDKEIALFAAESLNALENEYNEKLTNYKKKIREEDDKDARFSAAELYYQLALLNQNENTLSRFYMKEAYLLLNEGIDEAEQKTKMLLIQVLFRLGLYDQAEKLLPEGRKGRLLKLEIAYGKKDMNSIKILLNEIASDEDALPEEKKIFEFWAASHA